MPVYRNGNRRVKAAIERALVKAVNVVFAVAAPALVAGSIIAAAPAPDAVAKDAVRVGPLGGRNVKETGTTPDVPKEPSQTESPKQSSAAESFEKQLPPIMNVSPPHFMRIENEKFGEKIDSDYLSDIMQHNKNRVFRFKTMPIPVYIAPFPDGRFITACIGGFENWESQTDGLVRFVQVNEQDRARISVVWDHLGTGNDNNQGALGAHTLMKWKEAPGGKSLVPIIGPKYKVPPQVISINLDVINSRDFETRPLLLRNIVTHELGHALGLIGHSPYKCDIMYSDTDEYSRLSQRDVNTIIELYKLKADVQL